MKDIKEPTTRLIHSCEDFTNYDALVMYCSAVYSDVSEMVDWYAWEQHPLELSQTLTCIMFCPWCGMRLPDTPAEALVNPTFSQEPVDEDDPFYDEEEVP